MSVSWFALITAYLANTLVVQAEHCKCFCQSSTQSILQKPQFPSGSAYGSGGSFGYHLGSTLGAHVGRSETQFSALSGYKSSGQYQVAENEAGENADGYSKVSNELGIPDQLSYSQPQQHGIQGHFGSSIAVSSPKQPELSNVSVKDNKHYINIEQKISPQSEGDEDKKKDHHHGKDDYYKFEYGVNDQKTHDIKHQKEEKKGDVVKGEYSLVEHDGNVRTVKYYADWKTGFHAQVHNSKSTSLG